MSDEPKEGKGGNLPEINVLDPLPPSEREAFEGKIKELNERIEELENGLREAIAQLKESKKPAKKESAFQRFNPLG